MFRWPTEIGNEKWITRFSCWWIYWVRSRSPSAAPAILAKEIYALAAIVAAVIQVVGQVNGWSIGLTAWFAAGVCLVIRFLALRYSWGLPVVRSR